MFVNNGISFSRPSKSVKIEWGLWRFVNFVVFRAVGKNYQLISQKLHFPRPNSSLNKNICRAKSERTQFLSVLTDRVHRPSAAVRVAPLYRMCGSVSVPSSCFSAPYYKGLWKVCEFWKFFSCVNPVFRASFRCCIWLHRTCMPWSTTWALLPGCPLAWPLFRCCTCATAVLKCPDQSRCTSSGPSSTPSSLCTLWSCLCTLVPRRLVRMGGALCFHWQTLSIIVV